MKVLPISIENNSILRLDLDSMQFWNSRVKQLDIGQYFFWKAAPMPSFKGMSKIQGCIGAVWPWNLVFEGLRSLKNYFLKTQKQKIWKINRKLVFRIENLLNISVIKEPYWPAIEKTDFFKTSCNNKKILVFLIEN